MNHAQAVDYAPDSITLGGAVAMGTGVMIGAGIFALTGQIADLELDYTFARSIGAQFDGVLQR